MNSDFDYHSFLKSRYEEQKMQNPRFSARYFARKAGISSPSYFAMVLSGQRRLTTRFARKFAKGLKLNEQETLLLVRAAELEECEDENLKFKLLGEIKKLGKKILPPIKMCEDHVEILGRPLELSLYVLSQSDQFLYDMVWIRKQPGFKYLPVVPLQKAMQALVRSKLWEITDGKIAVRPPNLDTGSRSTSRALKQSHLKFLEIARFSLLKLPPDERVFLGQTFLCDPKKINLIEKRLSQVKAELEAEFEDLSSTAVYQMHLGFFPLRSLEGSREE